MQPSWTPVPSRRLQSGIRMEEMAELSGQAETKLVSKWGCPSICMPATSGMYFVVSGP